MAGVMYDAPAMSKESAAQRNRTIAFALGVCAVIRTVVSFARVHERNVSWQRCQPRLRSARGAIAIAPVLAIGFSAIANASPIVTATPRVAPGAPITITVSGGPGNRKD